MDAVIKPLAQFRGARKRFGACPRRCRSEPSAPVARGGRGRGQNAARLYRRRSQREGLVATPRRVVEAFEELYAGYNDCPADVLDRTFGETAAMTISS